MDYEVDEAYHRQLARVPYVSYDREKLSKFVKDHLVSIKEWGRLLCLACKVQRQGAIFRLRWAIAAFPSPTMCSTGYTNAVGLAASNATAILPEPPQSDQPREHHSLRVKVPSRERWICTRYHKQAATELMSQKRKNCKHADEVKLVSVKQEINIMILMKRRGRLRSSRLCLKMTSSVTPILNGLNSESYQNVDGNWEPTSKRRKAPSGNHGC